MNEITIRKAILFLSKEFGFKKVPSSAQNLTEMLIPLLQQGVIEFNTEDYLKEINIHVELENGLKIRQSWYKDE